MTDKKPSKLKQWFNGGSTKDSSLAKRAIPSSNSSFNGAGARPVSMINPASSPEVKSKGISIEVNKLKTDSTPPSLKVGSPTRSDMRPLSHISTHTPGHTKSLSLNRVSSIDKLKSMMNIGTAPKSPTTNIAPMARRGSLKTSNPPLSSIPLPMEPKSPKSPLSPTSPPRKPSLPSSETSHRRNSVAKVDGMPRRNSNAPSPTSDMIRKNSSVSIGDTSGQLQKLTKYVQAMVQFEQENIGNAAKKIQAFLAMAKIKSQYLRDKNYMIYRTTLDPPNQDQFVSYALAVSVFKGSSKAKLNTNPNIPKAQRYIRDFLIRRRFKITYQLGHHATQIQKVWRGYWVRKGGDNGGIPVSGLIRQMSKLRMDQVNLTNQLKTLTQLIQSDRSRKTISTNHQHLNIKKPMTSPTTSSIPKPTPQHISLNRPHQRSQSVSVNSTPFISKIPVLTKPASPIDPKSSTKAPFATQQDFEYLMAEIEAMRHQLAKKI